MQMNVINKPIFKQKRRYRYRKQSGRYAGKSNQKCFLDKVKAEGRIPPTKCLRCIHTCNPAETPYCITEALIHAAKGEVDQALYSAEDVLMKQNNRNSKKVIDYFCKDCL